MNECVVIGCGVAGLTAAAVLADDGMQTLAIERHNVAGGCASFYQCDGFRFDVGATLVGGFGPRGVHTQIFATLGEPAEAVPVEPAMVVHLDGDRVVRFGDERWNDERLRAFGPETEPFWRWQERIADAAWDLSSRFPSAPADPRSSLHLARAARPRQAILATTLGRTLASIVPHDASPKLRAFLDAQLLITAQTDARHADLAYGATALDLARGGTFHLDGGVSTISSTLARAVRKRGSSIRYRTDVVRIRVRRGRVSGVVLDDGSEIVCERVVAAVPLERVVALCPEVGDRFAARVAAQPQRYGAFALYVGLPPGVVPDDLPLHHQIVADVHAPLGEGNSTFLSFSEPGAAARARGGGRAVTISTHTDVARWERAVRDGSYDALRERYARRLAAALDTVLPGASTRALLAQPATPWTFARYTGRARGLVGGVPQTPDAAGIAGFSHVTPVRGLVVCGDSVFPGQSTVGATLSGVAAARGLGARFSPVSPRASRRSGTAR